MMRALKRQPRASRASRTKRALRAGYTAVEVMLAVAVLAVGASGVIAMQRASIQGNNDARMMDVANSLAHQWLERVRRDGFSWTQPDERIQTGAANAPLVATWDQNTFIIKQIASTGQVGTFRAYTSTTTDGYSPASDIQGHDVLMSGSSYPNAVFCTQLRADWLVQDQLLRVTARVYWSRQLFSVPSGTFCVDDTPSAANANQLYHFVYATTAVRRNPGR